MNNIVKIGSRYINLDNVYQISFNDKQREQHPETGLVAELDVILPVSMYPDEEDTGVIEPAGMRVFDLEAEALRYYLDNFTGNNDVLQMYQGHLETIGAKKKQAERDTRFTTFCKEKGLEGDDRYYYRLWLDADSMTEEEAEPGEESLKAWRSWQLENFNQAIAEMAKIYSLSDKQVNDFRTYCAEHEGYTRPTHSDYGRWCQLQKYPAI
jgi:hypothetical protein